jgi:hypothetical protein
MVQDVAWHNTFYTSAGLCTFDKRAI